jgi:hypothetical protein
MEHVSGTSLARVIASEAPLDERRVVHIGAQILSALAEAHANDILHRDLKPENVMIEARRNAPDSVKVLDFGIAKMLAPGAAASTLTQVGLVCGTPGYMSPEQLRGGDVDARSDLFSVGVVLYEMLTHRLPFEVPTPMEMLHRQLSYSIPPPGELRGRPVSPMLEALVMSALSPSPDGRPPGADAMRERLLAVELSPPDPGPAAGDEPQLPTEVFQPADGAPTPSGATATRTATRTAPRPATRTATRTAPRSTPPSPAPRSTPPSAARRSTTRAFATAPPATRTGTQARPAGATRSTPAGTPPRTGTVMRTAAAGQGAAWDPAVLKRIEERVAPLVGPVALHLVRKTSRGAATLGEVCRQLAQFIRSPEDRQEFLAWSESELQLDRRALHRAATPPPSTAARPSWDPEVLDRARHDVAAYVGPLARILVRRASARATSVEELYQLLAVEIPSDAERERFLRDASRGS